MSTRIILQQTWHTYILSICLVLSDLVAKLARGKSNLLNVFRGSPLEKLIQLGTSDVKSSMDDFEFFKFLSHFELLHFFLFHQLSYTKVKFCHVPCVLRRR